MGTWDSGLYDNDSALDDLATLITIADDERDAARLVTGIGLLAWMNPIRVSGDEDGRLAAATQALAADIEGLPADTRAALQALLADPEGSTARGSRSKDATAVIGGYADGPRIDALLRFPGAEPVVTELGEAAARRLDKGLQVRGDLYEAAGSLAALGVVIELRLAELWRPEEDRVNAWRAGFDVIDQATTAERRFWWRYVRRVRRGFDLLAPAPPTPPKPPKAAPKPRKRAPKARAATPLPEGPLERFSHPKFGVGVLLSRSSVGDADAIELRFDDGAERKILARFLTAIED